MLSHHRLESVGFKLPGLARTGENFQHLDVIIGHRAAEPSCLRPPKPMNLYVLDFEAKSPMSRTDEQASRWRSIHK